MATPVPPPMTSDPAPGLDEFTADLFAGPDKPGAAFMPGPRKISPYEDDEALAKFYAKFEELSLDGRQAQEQEWWRKLLYRAGRHWIALDGQGRWRDKRLAKWVPKPVTNKVHEAYQTILSVMVTVDPSIVGRPLGERPEDITTAEVATKLEEAIKSEHQMRRVWMKANFWHIVTGNVFFHPWWDADKTSATVLLPYFTCARCQATYAPSQLAPGGLCPTCGPTGALMEAQGPDGAPRTESYDFGTGRTDVCSPLEIALPDGYGDFDDVPGLIHMRWRPMFYYERMFTPEQIEAANLSEEQAPDLRSLQLLRQLAQTPDIHDGRRGEEGYGSEGRVRGVTEKRLWHKPCEQYPDGLFMVVAGQRGQSKPLRLDEATKPQPLPYVTPNGDPIWPWVHLPYERVDGRVWGESPLSLIIQKNDQINQIDSLIQMMATRTANPAWLHPKGAEVKHLTGEPGLIIKYNPMAGAGQTVKPERIEGANIPASVIGLRQQYLLDIENAVGTYDVMKGAKPPGISAFSAMQLMVERSQSRFAPVLMERGDAYARLYSIQLELERSYGPPSRTEAVMGPNSKWTFQTYQMADLSGNVVFTIEDGSNAPKTNLGMRASIDQLKQLGVVDLAQASVKYRVLQVFGRTDMDPGLDVHVRAALQEQSEWEEWAAEVQLMPGPPQIDPMTGMATQGPPMPSAPMPGERQVWTNDQIHAEEHIKWANSDGVRRLLTERPELSMFLTFFIQQHLMAMMPPPMMGDQPGEPGALARSNGESGNPADVPRGNAEFGPTPGPM